MTEFTSNEPTRRRFLAGAGATGALLALPGCESIGGFSLVDAVRRILYLSTERAFARMLAPGGFWDEQVATLGLDQMLGVRGNILSSILTSSVVRQRLDDTFADIALEGAERAAPIVTETVRVIGIQNAIALINGGPTAATEFLRQDMGTTLVEAMVPELGDAMRIAGDPIVRDLLTRNTGVDFADVAQTLSRNVDDTIWREMGVEEAAIRANPRATNDPLLIGVLGARNL